MNICRFKMYKHIFHRAAHADMYTDIHCCFDSLYECFSCVHMHVLVLGGGDGVVYGLSSGPSRRGMKTSSSDWVSTNRRGDTVWIVRERRVFVISVMVRGTGAGHKAVWLPLDIGISTLLVWSRSHCRQSPRNRLPCALELSWLHGTGVFEQCWPLTVSVSVLDVARQPAGAFGAGMQRVPCTCLVLVHHCRW